MQGYMYMSVHPILPLKLECVDVQRPTCQANSEIDVD